MKKTTVIALITLLSVFIIGCDAYKIINKTTETDKNITNPEEWETVQEGLFFKKTTVNEHEFIISKINPELFDMKIVQNNEPSNIKNIKEIHEQEQSLLTINGSFFDEKFKPIALLISDGKIINNPSGAELTNGIFALSKNEGPRIIESKKYNTEGSNYDFAIQNGPLLILDSKSQITKDTGKKAARTTIGIDNEGKIIVIVLRQPLLNPDNALSLYEFTQELISGGLKELNIISLLNLDGGVSTGMAIKNDYYPELEKVQNIIIIKPKVNSGKT
jgi:uncharacterized protein YigE (DUF2233 family)